MCDDNEDDDEDDGNGGRGGRARGRGDECSPQRGRRLPKGQLRQSTSRLSRRWKVSPRESGEVGDKMTNRGMPTKRD